ncbi:porin [Vibrio sp. OCN044]|uniref:Porin n=1 Tax=Vibrio tetraodonis subsp. pristinus TaxID=2695891 RepID=A0A6L8LQ66_9VIBR|nr:porin [Vibrio tetraodonis]MYM58211.1 porin [Vibrio tetraodonis subsp. pristinus]
MKKTLVALSVLAAAANVNAAEVYSTDASKVSLSGEVDAYVATTDIEKQSTDAGKKRTKTDPSVMVWGKIQLDAEHKVSDTLTTFASFEIESQTGFDSSEADNNAKFDDLYVGVKTDTWGVAVGEVGDLAESMDAIEKGDITNEGQFFGSAGGHRSESEGHGIVFKAELTDGLVFVADANTEASEDLDNTYGASLDWAINDMFSVGASLVNGEAAKDIDYQVGGVSASATLGGFFFAATYSQFEGVNSFGLFGDKTKRTVTSQDDPEITKEIEDNYAYTNGDAYGVALQYTIDKTRLYATYDVMSLDEQQNATTANTDAKGDVTNLVLGVEYSLLDNVTIFTEYQTAETSNDFTGANNGAGLDADTFVLGTYYTF